MLKAAFRFGRAFVSSLRLHHGDFLVAIGVVKIDHIRGGITDLLGLATQTVDPLGDFAGVELTVAIVVPAVELLQKADHLAFHFGLGDHRTKAL